MNGKRYGIHFESMLAELHPGENSIVVGEFDGNQHYKLTVGG